jgi:hypothetical protein
MPWTIDNPPDVVKNKPKAVKEVAVQAGNAALANGRTEEEAIFAIIAAIKREESKNAVKKALGSPTRALNQVTKGNVANYYNEASGKVPEHLRAILAMKKPEPPPVIVNPLEDPKLLIKMIRNLEKEVKAMKDAPIKYQIPNLVAMGGRTELLLMDDIDRTGIQDGATPVWDDIQKKFKMVVPTPVPPDLIANLQNGAANQALVKVSATDFDYKWEDMIITTPGYNKLIDKVSDTLMYIGEAVPTALVTDALWRIKKVQQSPQGITIEWADDDSTFTKVWNDRATYLYDVTTP